MAQAFPHFTLSGGTFDGDGRASFKPLAWQALFLGGMLAGKWQVHLWIRDYFAPRHRFLALLGVAGLFTMVFLLDGKAGVSAQHLNAKATLGPVRLLHSLVVLTTMLAVLYRLPGFRSTLPFATISMIGRHSLQCFVAGVFMNYVMVTMLYPANSLAAYLLIAAAGIMALIVLAALLEIHTLAKKGRLSPRAGYARRSLRNAVEAPHPATTATASDIRP